MRLFVIGEIFRLHCNEMSKADRKMASSYWHSKKSMRKLKISAHDVTSGWNVDSYCAQKGHKVRFNTNICAQNIAKIVWTFGDNSDPSTDTQPLHIFRTQFGVAGEGYVTVRAVVTTQAGKCLTACRQLLIVPESDCEIQFEDYTVGNDTKCIDLQGTVVCATLNLGDPLDGNNADYACGGACEQDCPRCSIEIGDLQGTKIARYGKHRVTASRQLVCPPAQNELCIPLYAENQLGKCARYPPVCTTVHILPRNLRIRVCGGVRRWHKRFVLDNLSAHMLPEDATIKWRIYDCDGRTHWLEIGRCKTLCYEFRCQTYYCVEAVVRVSADCEDVTTKVYILLADYCARNCDDIVVQPFSQSFSRPTSHIPEGESPASPPVPQPIAL